MAKLPSRREESLGGFIVHGIPFPKETDPESLAFLKRMTPIQIEQEYKIAYLHSYGQDSPFFAGLANGTFIFGLPGSSGACRTAWNKILQAQLDHRTRPCNFAQLIPRLLER